jgi:valyl-tRNA synthetase
MIKTKKDQSSIDVQKIIDIISDLRSFKNELNVSPGSFTDISIKNLNKDSQKFIKDNETVLKKLGRINKFHNEDLDKSAASMVISGEIYKIYFDENVDLDLIKSNLLKKQEKYQNELNSISKRLSNKGFVDRAPKEIVEQEKTNYNNLENDIKKISLTIEGI